MEHSSNFKQNKIETIRRAQHYSLIVFSWLLTHQNPVWPRCHIHPLVTFNSIWVDSNHWEYSKKQKSYSDKKKLTKMFEFKPAY